MSVNRSVLEDGFRAWSSLCHEDLRELLSSVNPTGNPNSSSNDSDRDETLRALVGKNLAHYRDYIASRAKTAKIHAPCLFAPTWNNTLENALLWIADFRPTIVFRLVYAIAGHEVESRLDDFLAGLLKGGLGELNCDQLNQISGLQSKTIAEEDKLSKRMAGLQEAVGDQPFSLMATARLDGAVQDVEALLAKHASALGEVLEAADRLRFETVRRLVEEIFTPAQAVEFLIATKQLQFCIHEWGLRREINITGLKPKNKLIKLDIKSITDVRA